MRVEGFRKFGERGVYTTGCECDAGGDDELRVVTEGRLPTIQDSWMFHATRENQGYPGASAARCSTYSPTRKLLHVGPAELLHRRCGKVPWRPLMMATGEGMEYDSQTPAQITSERRGEMGVGRC